MINIVLMKKIGIFICTMMICAVSMAQTRWINPIEAGAEVHGQGWPELRNSWYRLPEKARDNVREDVWDLSRNAAGLSLSFRSNSRKMTVRYQVKSSYSMFHMPSTGKSGIDLYARSSDGSCRWVAEDFTPSFGDTIIYRYSNIDTFPSGTESYDYTLFLPCYNTVDWLEIGVEETADLTFNKVSGEKPIVIYGTSIAQGACASRPGMAWTNIISREMGVPVVNLGFSGNGRLEPELFDLLNEIDAAVFIIDCLPNLGPEKPIHDLLTDGILKLRRNHSCPIVLVDHSGYPAEATNSQRSSYRECNAIQKATFKELKKAGIKNLYYVGWEEIGMDSDCTVESVHPNDLGMRRYASGIEKKLKKLYPPGESNAYRQNRNLKFYPLN